MTTNSKENEEKIIKLNSYKEKCVGGNEYICQECESQFNWGQMSMMGPHTLCDPCFGPYLHL